MNQLTFTREDCANPERLERLLRQLNRILAEPAPAPTTPTLNLNTLAAQLAPLIRSQLQAPGNAPLNLQSLLPESGLGIVLENSHANRNSLYPASTTDVGALYWETDRTVLYTVIESAGVRSWRYVSGTYYATFANRPSDLGTGDANFRFVDSTADTQAQWMWTGTEWVTIAYLQEVTDAVTAASSIVMILRHLSSGNPAASFAGRLLWQLEDASNQTENAMGMDAVWSTATSGMETSDLVVYLRRAGAALAELLRLTGADGHLRLLQAGAQLQFGGATASFPAFTRGATTTNTRSVLADGSASTDHEVLDEAYDPTNWNGSLEVPTKNAVRDKIETVTGGETGALVSDTAFGAGWNGVTGIAPSKNAVYDELVQKVNGTGVNFGPGAVASITVVNGVITAIS